MEHGREHEVGRAGLEFLVTPVQGDCRVAVLISSFPNSIFPEINSNSTLAGSGALFGFQSGRPFGGFGKETVFTPDFQNRGDAQGGLDAALRPDRRS
jgi:hypothetical protein